MTNQTDDHLRFLRSLRAVRHYTSDPIPDDVLNAILDVGRWSGTASNVQHTEIVVVRDAAVKQRMGEVGADPAAGAAAVLVIVTPGDPDRFKLEVFDCGRLVERLLLAAHAIGIGANIAGLKEDGPQVIKEMLGIPAARYIWPVVTLGYTDDAAHKARARKPTTGRRPAEDFLHWVRY